MAQAIVDTRSILSLSCWEAHTSPYRTRLRQAGPSRSLGRKSAGATLRGMAVRGTVCRDRECGKLPFRGAWIRGCFPFRLARSDPAGMRHNQSKPIATSGSQLGWKSGTENRKRRWSFLRPRKQFCSNLPASVVHPPPAFTGPSRSPPSVCQTCRIIRPEPTSHMNCRQIEQA